MSGRDIYFAVVLGVIALFTVVDSLHMHWFGG
jgi:hypothetical protein